MTRSLSSDISRATYSVGGSQSWTFIPDDSECHYQNGVNESLLYYDGNDVNMLRQVTNYTNDLLALNPACVKVCMCIGIRASGVDNHSRSAICTAHARACTTSISILIS